MILRFIVFACASILTTALFVRNTGAWSEQFRDYMIREQSKATFTGNVSWQRPWTVFLSKAMIIFFGLMVIVLTYVLCISQ